MTAKCRKCGAEWTGAALHCTVCHSNFPSIEDFDLHRTRRNAPCRVCAQVSEPRNRPGGTSVRVQRFQGLKKQ